MIFGALKRSSFENGLKIKDLKNSPDLIKDILTPTFNSCMFSSFYKERKNDKRGRTNHRDDLFPLFFRIP
ncbi:hypothetical protein ABIE66_001890 [Peribacillus sp. B2I2]